MAKLSLALAALGLALLVASALPATATSPAPAPATPAGAEAGYGKALFVAKGCVACHHHAAVARSGQFGGEGTPDLSSYRGDAEFLQRWLADPPAVRPGTAMPKLGLSEREIAALSTFLLRL
ncbi:c-type cytochrome [Kouleothrix sp.]|uniref:c-type cytochrome n=1 Tax=Kouleothrix sp. TaxID=2779161 RepID=UPI00391B5C11